MLGAVLSSMSKVSLIELTQVAAALLLRNVGGVLTEPVSGSALMASWSAWSGVPLLLCMS